MSRLRRVMHTFLVREGRWRGHGSATSRDGISHPATGITVIEHRDEVWLMDSTMRVESIPPADYHTIYEVTPFDFEIGIAEWSSQNEDLGPLIGRLLVVEDVIHTQFRTRDGCCSGVERMQLERDGSYTVAGSLFEGARRLTSWTMALTRDRQLS